MISMYDVPILMNVFRRPIHTIQVINAIAKVKPKRLYVAADGPRPGVEGESEQCAQVRILFEKLPWDCQVHTFYREQNVGSRLNESGGMSWFFSHEPVGIILEDDCLPHIDFFHYCRELLFRYKNDKRIMHIAGTQVIPNYKLDASYFFSRIPLGWGWASWADRWAHYDESMADYAEFRKSNHIAKLISDPNYQNLWRNIFDAVYEKKVDAWDFIWIYYVIKNNGICINPTKNLISNIGFGKESTYCEDANHKHANLPVFELGELVHPRGIKIDEKAVRLIYEYIWNTLPYKFFQSNSRKFLYMASIVIRRIFGRIRRAVKIIFCFS
jgi:hypothetical protein